MSLLILIAYVFFTSAGLIVIKLGTAPGQHILQLSDKLSIPFNLPIFAGIFLYGMSFVLYIYLISKFDLGYIIPLTTALVYILIFIASFIIFKEPFTMLKIAAIGLIVCGLVLLNLGK